MVHFFLAMRRSSESMYCFARVRSLSNVFTRWSYKLVSRCDPGANPIINALIAILPSRFDISGRALVNLAVYSHKVLAPCLIASNEFVDFWYGYYPSAA